MKNKIWLWALLIAPLLLPACKISAQDMSQPVFSGFNAPTGMVYDKKRQLYVSEWSTNRIATIKDGQKSIILDGLPSPAGLAFDNDGNLYIAGYGDGNIYVWDGKGKPRILASDLSSPTGLLWSNDNNLLVANRNAGEIVKINANGDKKVISRGHKTPVGLAQTNNGNLFVSCYGGSIDIIFPDGKVSSISNELSTPGLGIVPAGPDSVYVVDYTLGNIVQISLNGVKRIIAKGLSSPVGLAIMPDKRIIVSLWGDNSLRIINNQGAHQ